MACARTSSAKANGVRPSASGASAAPDAAAPLPATVLAMAAENGTVAEGSSVVGTMSFEGWPRGSVARVVGEECKYEYGHVRFLGWVLERACDGQRLRGPGDKGSFPKDSVAVAGGALGGSLLHAAVMFHCSADVVGAVLEAAPGAVESSDALGRSPLTLALEVRAQFTDVFFQFFSWEGAGEGVIMSLLIIILECLTSQRRLLIFSSCWLRRARLYQW